MPVSKRVQSKTHTLTKRDSKKLIKTLNHIACGFVWLCEQYQLCIPFYDKSNIYLLKEPNLKTTSRKKSLNKNTQCYCSANWHHSLLTVLNFETLKIITTDVMFIMAQSKPKQVWKHTSCFKQDDTFIKFLSGGMKRVWSAKKCQFMLQVTLVAEELLFSHRLRLPVTSPGFRSWRRKQMGVLSHSQD